MRASTEELGRLLTARQAFLAVAESCTGGLVAKRITDIAGSSAWFERGFVTYSNASKRELLGVSQDVLDRVGAVSRECAEAMARGLMVMTPAHWGVAITGIAGPGGGSPEKPVGLVWLAWASRDGAVQSEALQLGGSREAIREASADAAIAGLLRRLA
ncbi:MAG TPA: CinA family protein [Verrucomicrobiae bacterium]|nr:CinA family protein [Verrucomicrobiae bacterium]